MTECETDGIGFPLMLGTVNVKSTYYNRVNERMVVKSRNFGDDRDVN